MTGTEKDLSEILSIDEQIARVGERMRLMEEFWRLENREEKNLGGLDDLLDAVNDNCFECVSSAQTAQGGAMYDMNRGKEKKRPNCEKVSLLATTPSRIPGARKIVFDQQPSLRAPLKASKIATPISARPAIVPSRERGVASSLRHLESKFLSSTYAAGSKIGRLNFLKQPGQDE